MKAFLLVFFIFIELVSISHAQENLEYRFGQKLIQFVFLKKDRITVSSSCYLNRKKLRCSALSILSKLSFKSIDRIGFGGAHPGSLLCKQQGNGKVIVGINVKTNNENSFCKLKDRSIIDNGTLVYYALKNDKK